MRPYGLETYVDKYAVVGRKLPHYVYNMPPEVEERIRKKIVTQRKLLNKFDISDDDENDELAFLKDDVFEFDAHQRKAYIYEDQSCRLTPQFLVELAMVELMKSIKIERLKRIKEIKEERQVI